MSVMRSRQQKLSEKADEERMLRLAAAIYARQKHETITSPNLFYCFVNISKYTSVFKFYIVPSRVVAKYVKEQHAFWLEMKRKEGKEVKDTDMRILRIGTKDEKYPVPTPLAEQYENNWGICVVTSKSREEGE
jgi:hypothetical protein